eukprot:TRINITY_DN19561_c0_g2_i1.p1 TRINITY_DN19561_c0_g2~~TRINITY_DN19561_c0_g2_i1.p1  ORF type:complete len:374 (+),score=26.73 TRINITY_DN19561_c0_g2_i1:224-1345(+)
MFLVTLLQGLESDGFCAFCLTSTFGFEVKKGLADPFVSLHVSPSRLKVKRRSKAEFVMPCVFPPPHLHNLEGACGFQHSPTCDSSGISGTPQHLTAADIKAIFDEQLACPQLESPRAKRSLRALFDTKAVKESGSAKSTSPPVRPHTPISLHRPTLVPVIPSPSESASDRCAETLLRSSLTAVDQLSSGISVDQNEMPAVGKMSTEFSRPSIISASQNNSATSKRPRRASSEVCSTRQPSARQPAVISRGDSKRGRIDGLATSRAGLQGQLTVSRIAERTDLEPSVMSSSLHLSSGISSNISSKSGKSDLMSSLSPTGSHATRSSLRQKQVASQVASRMFKGGSRETRHPCELSLSNIAESLYCADMLSPGSD